MRLVFHPKLSSDVDAIMDYYRGLETPKLADEFYEELRCSMLRAAANPELYSVRERDLRRVNLDRFPYHFLFRIVEDGIRILVVRHHQRNPKLGARRR